MSTSSLLAVVLLNPRALMAHWRESICATCRLLARRSASARLAAPERRMSSCVITWIADAVWDSRSGRFETDVTSTLMSCSILSFLRESAVRLESGCWVTPGWKPQTRSVRRIDVPAATALVSAIGQCPLLVASALGHNLQLPSGAARAFLRHRQAVSRHLGAEDLTALPTGRTLQGWTRKLPRQDSNLRPVDTERARPRARDPETKRLAAGKSRRKPRNAPESHPTDRPHTGTRRKRARRRPLSLVWL